MMEDSSPGAFHTRPGSLPSAGGRMQGPWGLMGAQRPLLSMFLFV